MRYIHKATTQVQTNIMRYIHKATTKVRTNTMRYIHKAKHIDVNKYNEIYNNTAYITNIMRYS